MNRGIITEEIKEKYNMTHDELRLIPYLKYLLVSQEPVDPRKINNEERKIMQEWRDKGYITFSISEPLTVSRKFWDIMNDFLWDCYVIHIEANKE